MRAGLLRPPAILLLLAGACSGSTSRDDVPLPTAVVPSAGYATVATAVEISGSRFFAKGTQPSVGGGATLDTRHRAWLGDVELADVTWVDTSKLTATVPAGLPLGAQKLTVENALGERGTLDGAFTVVPPPSFSATVSVDRTTVSVGQPFTLTLAVSNDGSADVTTLALGTPSLSSSDGALATLNGPAPSAPAALPAGARQSFTWTYRTTAAGHLAATVGATGKDALLGAALTATPPVPAQVAVQRPAALSAALAVPPSVAIRTDFTVTMTVTNSGDAGALAVTPAAPSLVAGSTGSASLKAGTGATPASADVPAGQSATFTWTYTAGAAIGPLRLSGGAKGNDANSSAAVTAAAATSNSTQVGNAAIIASIKSSPARAAPGQVFPIVVTFSNPGTANVTNFSATAPSISSPDPTKVTVTGPTPFPAPQALGAGSAFDLTWNASTSAPGRLAITFTAIGFDSGARQAIAGTATATIDVGP